MEGPGSPKEPRAKLNPKTYKSPMPLDQVVMALSGMSATDAEAVIRLREKDFGQNPKELINLLNAAEKSPELKTAIAATNLIETKHLNAPTTFQLLSSNTNEHLRELRNVATHRTKDKFSNNDSPKNHTKDEPPELVDYLIDHTESAYHFFREEKFREALAENPVLIAKMISEGNKNLKQSMIKAEITQLSKEQSTLDVFLENVKTLETNQQAFKPGQRESFQKETKEIGKTKNLRQLPKERIESLCMQTTQAIVTSIRKMLKELPDTKEKTKITGPLEAMEKRLALNDVNKIRGINPILLELHVAAETQKASSDSRKKVENWVHEGKTEGSLFQQSKQFQALMPTLEALLENKNATLTELTQPLRIIENEIQPLYQALGTIDKNLNDLRNVDSNAAKALERFRGDYNEDSPKKDIDIFAKGIQTTIAKLSYLKRANDNLAKLGADHPQYQSFSEQLQEQRKMIDTELRGFNFKRSDSNEEKLDRDLRLAVQKAELQQATSAENKHEQRAAQTSLPAAQKWARKTGAVAEAKTEQTAAPTSAVQKKTATLTLGQAKKLHQKPSAPPPSPPSPRRG
ncbi:MAG TPA: hypothetical protein VGV92_04510 [Gammaproteobacteria bacterium]|nr:hypothetical protein [Gammaproteobacteria bacterium]